ncbi:hypothetical protein THRCLA_22478 [Thraustotheca clavata]|uniref:Uncharacterized protein n=1 Tax=Thraustotheca clavata TaxID=74557 RepID=A0A1V9Z0G6_9STRA|nr:hypothetical protein THRCLA_22478 [Thraustotheca clavata]
MEDSGFKTKLMEQLLRQAWQRLNDELDNSSDEEEAILGNSDNSKKLYAELKKKL